MSNNLLNKKAQLQMMQTVVALLIFFIVISIVMVMYMNNRKSSLADKNREFEDLGVLKKIKILNFLPEVQCSFGNVINPDCYDVIKLAAFEQKVQDKKFFYRQLLGNTRILIRLYDPDTDTWANTGKYTITGDDNINSWEIFNNEKEDYSRLRNLQMPISLYDPITDTYEFGVIIMEIYT